jgi:hypothetical protein
LRKDRRGAAPERDEGLGVVVLVGAEGRALRQPSAQALRRLAFGRSRGQGRLRGSHEPVAVLHQRMAEIAKTALLPVALCLLKRRAAFAKQVPICITS